MITGGHISAEKSYYHFTHFIFVIDRTDGWREYLTGRDPLYAVESGRHIILGRRVMYHGSARGSSGESSGVGTMDNRRWLTRIREAGGAGRSCRRTVIKTRCGVTVSRKREMKKDRKWRWRGETLWWSEYRKWVSSRSKRQVVTSKKEKGTEVVSEGGGKIQYWFVTGVWESHWVGNNKQ